MSKTKSKKNKVLEITYVALFAALLAACAQIGIPTGTVSFTLQTLAVCLAGGLLGWKLGTLSVFVYILIGAIGVPVFSNFNGGFGVLLGSTGGYIIGFIFTAFIVGIMTEKLGRKVWVCVVSMILGVFICYIFGTAWFAVVYSKQNDAVSLFTILSWCVIPFIIPDLGKITVATILTNKLHKFVKVNK